MRLSGLASLFTVGASIHAADAWDTWHSSNGGGNVYGEVGNTKINFGSTPPWVSFNAVLDQCGDLGCGGTVRHSTELVWGNQFGGQTDIILDVEGTFNNPGELGSKEDLVEMAKTVIGKSGYDFEKQVGHATDRCATRDRTGCHWGGYREDDQYRAADTVNVRYEADDGSFISYLNAKITISTRGDAGGICSDILTFGQLVASTIGVINPASGAAAGAFGLASLGCA